MDAIDAVQNIEKYLRRELGINPNVKVLRFTTGLNTIMVHYSNTNQVSYTVTQESAGLCDELNYFTYGKRLKS